MNKHPKASIIAIVFVTAIMFAHATVWGQAMGPLKVHPENPRYFMDGSGKPIYLTGVHTWSNFQDQGASDPPPVFDYDKYLDVLTENNHNFIRLWVWEQARWAPWSDGKESRPADWFVRPAWAYARTGPESALDGEPKYDLSRFEPAYFDRLRERVKKAQERGIYVSIMLFQGWSYQKAWLGGDPWRGHPYHPDNNIQKFNGNPNSDKGPNLNYPPLREKHAEYIRQVVDTVNDLDNVLYEVTNEGGQKDWDWFVVDTVHEYEKTKPKQHPVGLTAHGSESNDDILASPADWFSPGESSWHDLKTNPRAVDGKKVSLVDTDHVFGTGGDQQWVWKSFMRGHNVLFMDPYDDIEWEPVLASMSPHKLDLKRIRREMGQTRTFATRMNLSKVSPMPDLTSTTYCMATPGSEYLVYQPQSGAFQVTLEKGNYDAEWFNPLKSESSKTDTITGAGKSQTFTPPFEGEALLYLKKSGE